jgi:hypothetical protein
MRTQQNETIHLAALGKLGGCDTEVMHKFFIGGADKYQKILTLKFNLGDWMDN